VAGQSIGVEMEIDAYDGRDYGKSRRKPRRSRRG
jgi:hypothetical protein